MRIITLLWIGIFLSVCGSCLPLADKTSKEKAPILSPQSINQKNGKWIAFSTKRTGNFEVFLMDTLGKNFRNLTKHIRTDHHPEWASDGQSLIFSSTRADKNQQLTYIVGLEDREVIRWEDGSGHRYPHWSPDSSQIVFREQLEGNNELMIAPPGSLDAIVLTQTEAEDYFADWSPDSRVVLYRTILSLEEEWPHESSEIWWVTKDGQHRHRLTDNLNWDGEASFSPDGMEVLFSTNRDGNIEVYRMSWLGEHPVNLTQHDSTDMRASWSPDGQWVLFESNRTGNREIFKMRKDGSALMQLTNHTADDVQAVWQPMLNTH